MLLYTPMRDLIHAARQHHNYNIREYIKRYARDEFRKHGTYSSTNESYELL